MIAARKIGWVLVFCFLMFTGGMLSGCVEVEVDPDPPYPLSPYDYDYPEKKKLQEPWEHQEDFPIVSITQPVSGTFVTPGDINVSGTYAGPEIESVLVNDKEVELTGSNFTTTVRVASGQSLVSIVATAKDKDEIVYSDEVTLFVGHAALAEESVLDAFLIDFENYGLEQLGDFLSNILDGLDLTGEMKKATAGQKALFEVETAYIGNIDFVLKSLEEGLNVELLVSDVDFLLTVLGLEISLEMDGLVGSILTELEVDSENQVSLTIVGSDIALAHWDLEIPFIPDAIDLLLDLIVELLGPTIIDVLIEVVLEDALNDLLAGLQIVIESEAFDYSILPSLIENTDRNMTIGFDVELETKSEWNTEFQPEGYLATDSSAAEFEELTPIRQVPYGIGLALEDDMINQLMLALCASGSLDMELTDPILTTELLSIVLFSFEAIDPPLPVVFQFSPTAAPIMWGDSYEQTAYLTIPSYSGQLMIDRGEDGLWEAMSFGVDLTAPLSVEVNDDGSITFKLSEFDVDIEVLHNAIGQKNVENANRLFEEIFAEVLPELLATIENSLTLDPLTVEGLSLSIADLALFGSGNDYLGAFIGLEYN